MFFFFFYFDFDFHGRENELNQLNNLYDKDGFKFVVMYGRRRVGKSSLIQEFINQDSKPNISYMAIEQNDKVNLEGFSEVVLSKYAEAKSYLSSFESWDRALDYIISQARDDKLVLFIDEYPYIANSNASISSLLQKFIDLKFKSTNIMLILCGSSMSFMENQVLGLQSPLYGRRDIQFKIEPFDYYDSGLFFENSSNEDKALAYAVTGGIPLYLNKLKNYNSIEDGIKKEFLKKSGSLYDEPRNLLLQELREPYLYNAIITAIASGASRVNDISMRIGEDTKKVSKYLDTLISLKIIKKEFPLNERKERNGIYSITDNLFRFWYRFIPANNVNIESGKADYIYTYRILPALPDYMGHIFEDMCIQYLKRQNSDDVLPFIFDSIGRWWGSNPVEKRQEEIDILAVSEERALFCECKWKNLIGIDVLNSLISKSTIFPVYKEKYYCLFAKGDFTDELKQSASTNKNIILFTLNDLYNLDS